MEQTLAHEIHALRGMFMGRELILHDNATRAQSLQAEVSTDAGCETDVTAFLKMIERDTCNLNQKGIV